MKVVFTGGAGGHFYPLIAIAEALTDLVAENQLVSPQMYYLADKAYDEEALFANNIAFQAIPAGKVRRYFSLQNVSDVFKTLGGIMKAYSTLFKIFPDVVVSKGSYASVPVVIAAHWLKIPIIIHESDTVPGRANLLAAKYATRIAVSFPETVSKFPVKLQSKVAVTGIPIRKALRTTDGEAGKAALGLDMSAPTVLIFGGSSGSQRINEVILSALPDLVSFANVIHQTGKANFEEVAKTAHAVLNGNPNASRYHAHPFLNANSIRQAAGAADVIVSRAGATAIAEISLWNKPSILIPIPESISHDQRTNAYTYAHTGAAVVLEEGNLTPHVLASEVRRISTDPVLGGEMSARAKGYANPDAGRMIAEQIVRISIAHENR